MSESPSIRSRFTAAAARIASLMVIAAVAAGAANLVHPRKIAWVEDWSRYIEARALAAGFRLAGTAATREIVDARSHLIFDARPAADYRAGRLPGAVSLPYDSIQDEFQNVAVLLLGGQPILTYCSGLVCDESFLPRRSAWHAWAAGGPCAPAARPACSRPRTPSRSTGRRPPRRRPSGPRSRDGAAGSRPAPPPSRGTGSFRRGPRPCAATSGPPAARPPRRARPRRWTSGPRPRWTESRTPVLGSCLSA